MERLTIEKIKSLKEAMRSNMNVYFYDDVMKVFDELLEKRNAEEQGLLLRLPCKIGRKVFYVQECLAPSCKECKGFLRVDNCYCQYKARIFEQKFDYRHLQAFGKSVFLTKEEAEQALTRMEDNNGKHEN